MKQNLPREEKNISSTLMRTNFINNCVDVDVDDGDTDDNDDDDDDDNHGDDDDDDDDSSSQKNAPLIEFVSTKVFFP